MTRRYDDRCRRNQERDNLLGQVRKEPEDWAGDDRRRGGVSRTQAFTRNCRNQASDAKGEAQAARPRGESTEAGDWDGPTRSSVEGLVMGLERRGRVRLSYALEQLETG
jgi:hypothetical protein